MSTNERLELLWYKSITYIPVFITFCVYIFLNMFYIFVSLINPINNFVLIFDSFTCILPSMEISMVFLEFQTFGITKKKKWMEFLTVKFIVACSYSFLLICSFQSFSLLTHLQEVFPRTLSGTCQTHLTLKPRMLSKKLQTWSWVDLKNQKLSAFKRTKFSKLTNQSSKKSKFLQFNRF